MKTLRTRRGFGFWRFTEAQIRAQPRKNLFSRHGMQKRDINSPKMGFVMVLVETVAAEEKDELKMDGRPADVAPGVCVARDLTTMLTHQRSMF